MATATIEPAALEQIAAPMRPAMRHYAELICEIAGDNLRGLTAYGPVVGRTFDTTLMSAASALVLDHIDLGMLRRLAEHGADFGRRSITAPLIMTPDYIAKSLDTFPLELLEIHQHHATLFGQDHFATYDANPDDLRLQCEGELKRVLIRLRQGLLAAAGREDVLNALELDIGVQLLRTLRGWLWLKDRREPLPRDRVVSEAEHMLGRPLPGIRATIQTQGEHGWGAFQQLYADVEHLAGVTDAL